MEASQYKFKLIYQCNLFLQGSKALNQYFESEIKTWPLFVFSRVKCETVFFLVQALKYSVSVLPDFSSVCDAGDHSTVIL